MEQSEILTSTLQSYSTGLVAHTILAQIQVKFTVKRWNKEALDKISTEHPPLPVLQWKEWQNSYQGSDRYVAVPQRAALVKIVG